MRGRQRRSRLSRAALQRGRGRRPRAAWRREGHLRAPAQRHQQRPTGEAMQTPPWTAQRRR
eukprot:7739883-Lingulodinium_polyedra.AAC.1